MPSVSRCAGPVVALLRPLLPSHREPSPQTGRRWKAIRSSQELSQLRDRSRSSPLGNNLEVLRARSGFRGLHVAFRVLSLPRAQAEFVSLRRWLVRLRGAGGVLSTAVLTATSAVLRSLAVEAAPLVGSWSFVAVQAVDVLEVIVRGFDLRLRDPRRRLFDVAENFRSESLPGRPVQDRLVRAIGETALVLNRVQLRLVDPMHSIRQIEAECFERERRLIGWRLARGQLLDQLILVLRFAHRLQVLRCCRLALVLLFPIMASVGCLFCVLEGPALSIRCVISFALLFLHLFIERCLMRAIDRVPLRPQLGITEFPLGIRENAITLPVGRKLRSTVLVL